METLMNQALNQIAEVELIYKTKIKASERPKLRTSKDAADLLKHSWDENKIDFVEQFKVLFLNRANKVLGIFEASRYEALFCFSHGRFEISLSRNNILHC